MITGAGAGIGRAGALLFARAGARVVVMDVLEDRVHETVEVIRSEGGDAVPLVADLALPGVSEAIADAAAERLEGLDTLWCNAGILGPTEVENIDSVGYDATVAINMTSPIRSCGAALRHLRNSRCASIVITSSASGLVGASAGVIYGATKFAVVGYTKSLALQVARDGIRVNAICPGPVLTPMIEDLVERGTKSMTGPQHKERLLASVPLNRFAAPEEIAEAALWLASPGASYVTGVALAVDGGFTAR